MEDAIKNRLGIDKMERENDWIIEYDRNMEYDRVTNYDQNTVIADPRVTVNGYELLHAGPFILYR